MSLENLPGVIAILLPGFVLVQVFFWTDRRRPLSDLKRFLWSLSASILILVLVAPIWHSFDESSPSVATILASDADPHVSTPLALTLFIVAVPTGLILGKVGSSAQFQSIAAKIGIDFRRQETVWWLVLREQHWLSLRLTDGTLLRGWASHLSRDLDPTELYLSPVSIWDVKARDYVSPPYVSGMWVNGSQIVHIEVLKNAPTPPPAVVKS